MFSLSLLFLILPIYFSHIFMHFGVIIGDSASFERQKMYLFMFTILLALGELAFRRYDGFIIQIKKYGLIIFSLSILPFIPVVLYNSEIDIYWIRGSYEKFHGYLLYIGIIILGFCLSLLKIHEKKRLVHISMIPVIFVSFIAILEGNGFQVFFPSISGTWGEGIRAISTLGNPNYLAGYLLIMLPLMGYIRIPERYILTGLTIIALVMTWSYIGIIIVALYCVYTFLWKFSYFFRGKYNPLIGKINWTHIPEKGQKISWGIMMPFFLIVIFLVIWGYLFISEDKLLSLSGRFILMWELIKEILNFPYSLLNGFGPEAVLKFFSESRSTLVDSYFPRNSIIDSSHNIILDIIFQYGIIPVILLISIISKIWDTWNYQASMSVLLGTAFLMFNPYVISHLVLLSLSVSLYNDKDEHESQKKSLSRSV